MKKIFSVVVITVVTLFAGGCQKNSSNSISVVYEGSNKKEEIIEGIKNSIVQIKNASFVGSVVINEEKHSFLGKVIVGDTIATSVIKFEFDDIEMYLKDGMVYIGYIHDGAKFVIKDNLDVFVREITSILNDKDVKCEVDKVKQFVYNYMLKEIDYEKISSINVNKRDNNYIIDEKEYEVILNEKYLPISVNYNNDNIKVDCKFNYDKVSFGMPLGYDMFSFSIDQVKHLLKIDSFADLF